MIHLNWDKSKTSPCIVAFETAYNAYYNQEPGMAVSKTIFEDFFDVIYDSGPFQVLVNKFNASGIAYAKFFSKNYRVFKN